MSRVFSFVCMYLILDQTAVIIHVDRQHSALSLEVGVTMGS